jgi:hypothetical protein
MIDILWINNGEIKFALEVENSTNFTSGIQRASNLGIKINKIMVLPDKRSDEFKSIKDPLFVDSFRHYGWKYVFYSEVDKLKSIRKISGKDIEQYCKEI